MSVIFRLDSIKIFIDSNQTKISVIPKMSSVSLVNNKIVTENKTLYIIFQ